MRATSAFRSATYEVPLCTQQRHHNATNVAAVAIRAYACKLVLGIGAFHCSEHTAEEVRKYSSHAFDKAPQYVFGGGNLPLHPSLQAMGRHYFTW